MGTTKYCILSLMEEMKEELKPGEGGFVASVKGTYKRYERLMPIIFFFLGFGWDYFTLTRIDRLMDNMILLAYLLLAAGLIVISNMADAGVLTSGRLLKFKRFYPLGIQFFLGGLFSAYVVFYFYSASTTRTSIFLVLLVALFVANEFLHLSLNNTYVQTGFFFVAAFSFTTFFLPVVTKVMNLGSFVAGGILSTAFVGAPLLLFRKKHVFKSKKQFLGSGGVVLGLLALFNVFYVFDLMPPVPLALKAAGVYHNVQHKGDAFLLTQEKPKWYRFWKKQDNPFYFREGDRVYCFASIFAPTTLKKGVLHHWLRYDEKKGEWKTTDKIPYSITGGRDGGYRGVTFKEYVQPGKWRVEVRTDGDRLLGRVDFKIKPSEGEGERKFVTETY